MLQAELRVMSGKQSGHVIPLVTSRFLIGREEDCHLRPNSDLVSRHHCVFKVDDYSLRVRDLGSTNGTFVNGERLRGEVMLNTGDRVTVGKLEFEVAVGDAATHVEAAAALPAAQNESFALGEAVAHTPTVEIPAFGSPSDDETTEQRMPSFAEPQPSAQETVAFQGDTMHAGYPPPMPMPGYAQMPPGYGMPYPQQYPYAQPYGMPMMGYPQPGMSYPPVGMYPQSPMPMQPPVAPAAESATPLPANRPATPDVRLPDPSETGAKPPEVKTDGGGGKNAGAVMRDTAAEIIKQYTQRRPQT